MRHPYQYLYPRSLTALSEPSSLVNFGTVEWRFPFDLFDQPASYGEDSNLVAPNSTVVNYGVMKINSSYSEDENVVRFTVNLISNGTIEVYSTVDFVNEDWDTWDLISFSAADFNPVSRLSGTIDFRASNSEFRIRSGAWSFPAPSLAVTADSGVAGARVVFGAGSGLDPLLKVETALSLNTVPVTFGSQALVLGSPGASVSFGNVSLVGGYFKLPVAAQTAFLLRSACGVDDFCGLHFFCNVTIASRAYIDKTPANLGTVGDGDRINLGCGACLVFSTGSSVTYRFSHVLSFGSGLGCVHNLGSLSVQTRRCAKSGSSLLPRFVSPVSQVLSRHSRCSL